MKIYEAMELCKSYGADTTLADLVRRIQGNKIHQCPKCVGRGKVTISRNVAEYWDCASIYKDFIETCDLCNGEGYVDREYKPKMKQVGWE